MKKLIGIYAIRNTKNNHVYVGQSQRIKVRIMEHRSYLQAGKHKNPYLQSAWNKYGECNFRFEKIMDCSKEDLDFYEKKLIKKYDQMGLSYNLAAGEKHGHSHPILSERAIQDDFVKSLAPLPPGSPKILIGSLKICKIFRLNAKQFMWWRQQPNFPVRKIGNTFMGHYDNLAEYFYQFELAG